MHYHTANVVKGTDQVTSQSKKCFRTEVAAKAQVLFVQQLDSTWEEDSGEEHVVVECTRKPCR